MQYPIVKIDRTTVQEWLPIIMNRGIFSRYKELPDKQEIINDTKLELGVDDLTPEQEREALAEANEYKTNRYVIRDYGSYAIGFDIKIYQDFLTDIEGEILGNQYEKERVEKALRQIHLYKLAHKLAMIILSEAYRQRKYEGLVITKEMILSYLGYCADEKQIYHEIEEAMFSLRWLDYVIYKYKTKKGMGLKGRTTGNFIYNLEIDKKSYTLWINKVFLGCIEHVLREETEELSDDEKKLVFQRGYFTYPTALLSMTRDYSTMAYLLAHFLTLDSGNNKLNGGSNKVVAYKASRFMKAANINNVRPGKRKNDLIKALSEIDILEKIEPNVEELRKIKPAMFDDTQIRVHIKK